MKAIFRSVLISYLILNFFYSKACINSNKPSATIFYNIRNSSEKNVFVIKRNGLTKEEQTFPNVIDQSKDFNVIKIQCDSGQIVYLKYLETSIPVFIEPGGTIYLSFDAKDIYSTIKYEGIFSAINNYLIEKRLKLDSLLPTDLRDLYSLPLQIFFKRNNQTLSELHKLQKKYLLDSINHSFATSEDADIWSQWAIKQTVYPEYHEYFTKEKINLPSDYYNFFGKTPLENAYSLQSENYVEFLSMYVDFKIKETSRANDTTLSIKDSQVLHLNEKYSFITTAFNNNEIAEFLTTQLLLSYLKFGFKDMFLEKYQNAKLKFRSRKYLPVANNRFLALKKIGSHKRAPDFRFIDINGKDLVLSNFKDYTVFINVWSLGCHGSLEELPYLKRLQTNFQQSDKIIFINIYNDNNIEILKDYLQSNEVGGIHGLAGGRESKFNKTYYINYTPRYILISRGKIVDAFAPRPSSNKLVPLLRSALMD